MALNLLGGLFKITILSVILLGLRDLIRSRKKSELIVFGAFFLIAVGAGVVFNWINRHKEYLEHSFLYKIQNAKVKTCDKYGRQPLDDYYFWHTVKEGDSLDSISNEYFGSLNKVEEIINLNNDRYPYLTVDNPFLEVGWQLKIPDHDLGPIWCSLIKTAGMVVDVRDGEAWVTYDKSATGAGPLEIDSSTDLINISKLKFGDCIFVYHDYCQSPYSSRTVRVEMQQ